MNLLEKLEKINKPTISKYRSGRAETIEDFWNNFIKPMLPSRDVVLKFNDLLFKYINDPDAVFVVRAFGSWNKGSVENQKDDELRRGFLTKPDNATYSYIFDDNFYAAYFVKMVYDGYCPEYEEFKDAMISRKFPARFGRSCQIEKNKAAFNISGKDPGISKAGYKIAHIVDAGKHFSIENNFDLSITDLSNIYSFPRGLYSDWNLELFNGERIYIRHCDVKPETLEILKAHFLRFVHPMNYFLAPKGKKGNKIYNMFSNYLTNKISYDIAEFKPLLNFVSEKYKEIYGQAYEHFLDNILMPNNFIQKQDGKQVIDISFGYFTFGDISVSSIILSNNTKAVEDNRANNPILSDSSEEKIGHFAKRTFKELFECGKINNEMLLQLMDKKYCSKELGISFPLIVDNLGTYDNKRYYKDILLHGKYRLCSQWYKKSKDKIKQWIIKNNYTIK